TLEDDVEMTLEANPRTISKGYLARLREIGFNRLSLGMQSAHPHELRLLGRIHDHSDVVEGVAFARAAGFDNLNLDLIHGLPGQGMERWQSTVELALGLSPDHLSIYGLTIEDGTPFGEWVRLGLLQQPDDDVAADQYEWVRCRLDQAGFRQYEISNWAAKRKGVWRECRHNLQYWRCQPYLGFGMAAHGYACNMRVANSESLQDYFRRINGNDASTSVFPIGPATASIEHLQPDTMMQEYLMVGLRLTREGVSRADFRQRFNVDMDERFGDRIARLRQRGLLEEHGEDPDRLRLTPSGALLGNIVFREFVGE
ncbi:MAG: coproporphyrinogen III oxidase family protein, partial [Anaerolineae bacterium]|nr:coproporphyrinogen III oxidase family protein [Anaerolineae bacterium]